VGDVYVARREGTLADVLQFTASSPERPAAVGRRAG
jgi:hypothetical protein